MHLMKSIPVKTDVWLTSTVMQTFWTMAMSGKIFKMSKLKVLLLAATAFAPADTAALLQQVFMHAAKHLMMGLQQRMKSHFDAVMANSEKQNWYVCQSKTVVAIFH